MVVVLCICYSLMLPRHLTKSLLKYCLMYCWTKMYVLELLIYCTVCILTSYAKLNGGGDEKSASFGISNGVKQGGGGGNLTVIVQLVHG